MMRPNTDLRFSKLSYYYLCYKCAKTPVDCHILTRSNPKSLTAMITLCEDYYHQQPEQQHLVQSFRRWNDRTWYYLQHPRNGKVHTMLVAYAKTVLISYVLEASSQSAQPVKPATLESMGMKHSKSWEKRERKNRAKRKKKKKVSCVYVIEQTISLLLIFCYFCLLRPLLLLQFLLPSLLYCQ